MISVNCFSVMVQLIQSLGNEGKLLTYELFFIHILQLPVNNEMKVRWYNLYCNIKSPVVDRMRRDYSNNEELVLCLIIYFSKYPPRSLPPSQF